MSAGGPMRGVMARFRPCVPTQKKEASALPRLLVTDRIEFRTERLRTLPAR
jgi:hypothetical protein